MIDEDMETEWIEGGCHCGRVIFRVQVDVKEGKPFLNPVFDCNCSICRKRGYLHYVVPKSRFVLKSGEESLSLYTFHTNTAKHWFCSSCGICSFYIPRSNPDGYSVNVRCLEGVELEDINPIPFDGVNYASAFRDSDIEHYSVE